MVEQLKFCPHCQGTDLKIVPRNWIDGGGFVLTCQNADCIARIWGLDANDVTARWNRRTPGPATKAMLQIAKDAMDSDGALHVSADEINAFLAEWPKPATPPAPAPEQPMPSSPWTCCICGGRVRIGDDLQPWHMATGYDHDAELSNADRKTLADGLRLTD